MRKVTSGVKLSRGADGEAADPLYIAISLPARYTMVY